MSMLKKKGRGGVKGILAVVLALALVLPLVLVPAPAGAEVADGVYSFGSGSYGKTGHGDAGNRELPERVAGLDNVKDVAAGLDHSVVLLHSGEVYTFGRSRRGQLGHGDTEEKRTPTLVEGISNAKAIAAGTYNTYIILQNGDVYSCGRNSYGQLGHSDREDTPTLQKMEGIQNAVAVSAGNDHALILLENGDVYAIGANTRSGGQLGLGDDSDSSYDTPQQVPLPGKAKDIAAGASHSLFLLENGDVYAAGSNRYGQLGADVEVRTTAYKTLQPVTGIGPAQAVSAGTSFSMVLLENGDVYTFGYGSHGRLGHGDEEDRHRPARVEGLSGVSMIENGRYHSLAVRENGDIYGFGDNSDGQLGLGDTNNRLTPERIEALSGNNALALAAYGHTLVLVGTPPITIEIDGQLLHTDVPPIILQGRTMVPLRAIFEALDTDVDYDPDTRLITGTRGATRIELTVDSTQATVNGEGVNLDAPATVMEGRTLVPVRFIAESTGQDVDWEARTRTVLITTIEPGDDFIEPGDDFIEPGDDFIEPGDDF